LLLLQGKLCWVLQTLAMCCGLHFSMKRLANAPTLQEQRKQWDSLALVYFCKHGPQLLVWLFSKLLALLLFNRFVLWFGGGVPGKQYALIQQDGIPIEKYLARTVDGELLCCYLCCYVVTYIVTFGFLLLCSCTLFLGARRLSHGLW
jgi:hypothetical protein